MGHNTQKVLETIESIERAPDSVSIVEAFGKFAKTFGFETLYIAQLVNPANVPHDRILHAVAYDQGAPSRGLRRASRQV
jgi:hypothetical protein